MLGKSLDLTFELSELDLVSGPGLLGKHMDFTFEFSEPGLASGPGVLRANAGSARMGNGGQLANLR